MNIEVWADIPGYEGKYQASNFGFIKSIARLRDSKWGEKSMTVKEKILSRFDDGTGYWCVNLCANNKIKKIGVHRLVLMAFHGIPENGMQACHNDGDRKNANLNNLRWDSAKSNNFDMIAHGTAPRGANTNKSILTEKQVIEIRNRPESSLKLSVIYGVASSTIRAVRLKQNWHYVD